MGWSYLAWRVHGSMLVGPRPPTTIFCPWRAAPHHDPIASTSLFPTLISVVPVALVSESEPKPHHAHARSLTLAPPRLRQAIIFLAPRSLLRAHGRVERERREWKRRRSWDWQEVEGEGGDAYTGAAAAAAGAGLRGRVRGIAAPAQEDREEPRSPPPDHVLALHFLVVGPGLASVFSRLRRHRSFRAAHLPLRV